MAGVLGIALIAGISAGARAITQHWPYAEAQVVPGLQDTFKTKVTVQRYRRFYFPHPGCELEMVRLAGPTNIAGEKPLAVAQKISITGRYSDLLFRPYHLAEIEVDGLHVRIPPRTEHKNWTGQTRTNTGVSKVSVGTVIANGTVLEIADENGKEPLEFEIHKLQVDSIAAGEPMSYEVSMGIPEPPGELESRGKFGPWQEHEIGKIPLSGTAKLNGARLDKYPGLGGKVRSEERFGGTLEQVEVTGEASAPDFELKSAGHAVGLGTQFQVIVNAMKGEAQLKGVVARVGKTTIHVRGKVAEDPKSDHREAVLDFSIPSGRAEDLLWVFSKAGKPAMFGHAICTGQVRMRKFGEGFLEALEANGKFEVKDGHFQPATQVKTNELSARASGKKIKEASEAPEVSVENLSSEVKIGNGLAHLSTVYFQVPGARARVDGTYNLLNSQVNFHGDLWTNAALSEDTSGIKAILLEPLDPLFRRKHAGAMIAVNMQGDIHNPRFGTVLTKRKAPWGKTKKVEKETQITK